MQCLDGKTQAWLAEKSGISEKTISDYVRGGIASTAPAIKIARALNVRVDWLLTGDDAQPGSIAAMVSPSTLATARGELAHLIPKPQLEERDDDLVEIEEIDLAYGLGGTYSDGAVRIQHRRFPRLLLERITSTPASMLTLARGRGDSMQPTVQDGDMVLIDRSQRAFREQDAVWALAIGELAMIKRVRIRGDRVHVLSDNDLVPPDDVLHEDITVVGRVIFIGRRI